MHNEEETQLSAPYIDKFIMISQTEMQIIYSHRSPVSITGKNPIEIFLFLHSPVALGYSDFERVVSENLEDTALIA